MSSPLGSSSKRGRLSISRTPLSGRNSLHGARAELPRPNTALQPKRQAATQPSYDFLSGQASETPGQKPLRRPASRQSLIPRPGSAAGNNNEDLRAEIKSLQYELENTRQERGLLTLQHEKEIRELQVKADADFKKAQAAEGVGIKASRRYEALQKEFHEAQDKSINEKAALERQIREFQDRNQSLTDDAEQAKEHSSDRERQYKHQVNEVESKRAALQETVDGLQQDLQSIAAELSTVNGALSAKNSQVEAQEAEIGQLKARAGDSDTLAVIQRELSEQVTHIRKLESTNREQSAELRKLRDAHKGVEVVEEQKRSLETELRVMRDVQRELGEVMIQKEVLEDERRAWTSLLEREGQSIEIQSPEAIIRAYVQEQIEHASAVDRLGRVEAELREKDETIRALEASKKKLKDEVEKQKAAPAAPPLPDNKAIKRIERQRTLALKEVEYLRAQLKTFDTEETVMFPEDNSFDAGKAKQIQELEALVDQYKMENQQLHDDLSKQEKAPPPVEPRGTKRTLDQAEDEDSQTGQLLRKNRNLQTSLTESQQKTQLLETELSAAQTQLSSLKTRSRTRILELRSNPTTDYFSLQQSKLTSLKAENEALLAQLRGEPHTTKVVPISTLKNKELDLQEMEKVVAEKEKRLRRLREIFTNKATEFRDVVASILGWKVDFLPNGKARLTSIFHLNNNNNSSQNQTGKKNKDDGGGASSSAGAGGGGGEEYSIIFDGDQGTMKFSGGPNSAFALECKDLVRFWVQERGEIPCFLAACVMESYEKTTRAVR